MTDVNFFEKTSFSPQLSGALGVQNASAPLLESHASQSDVVVMGGGIVGLAIALELGRRGATVTVLSRDFEQAAAHAAAGMLAPHAEDLLPGAMFDLCLRSLALYPEWIQKIEATSGLLTGYWPCGILAPVDAEQAAGARDKQGRWDAAVHSSPQSSRSRLWLDSVAIHHAQPGLSPEVTGGWWYPEDGQVDNRALARSLRLAAESLGVQIVEGIEVQSIQQRQGQVVSVMTNRGEWRSPHYVLATGAWSQALLPVPVAPRKGQMLSVALPPGCTELPLQRVLYGPGVYIVPRRDGRIVIGATSESVGFLPGNTPAGLQALLDAALRLFPPLQDLPIQECWWGFRPATPDELPILGESLCDNLTLAIGHYRNGILLAPITAHLVADWISQGRADEILTHFSWRRFFAGAESQSRSEGAIAPSDPLFTLSALTPKPSMLQYASSVEPELNSSMPPSDSLDPVDSPLVIAGRTFRSRLMTGTGKYRDFDAMRQSVVASGCEIITVAVRRVQTQAPGHEGLAEALDWSKLWMLPNTAGCQTAEDAVRVARLGREMAKLLGQEDNHFVKLEVIPDAKYLLPDPIGTLKAAEQLVKEGFAVLPYINADPLLAKYLEEAGCATVMPLGSPIGSGQGIRNAANIQIIVENAKIPVVVDAGIGTPSEAAQAMEMGADALLINTAIAQAQNPALMARAMGLATQAGRLAYLAGRIPVKSYASASSPLTGTIT